MSGIKRRGGRCRHPVSRCLAGGTSARAADWGLSTGPSAHTVPYSIIAASRLAGWGLPNR
jgi:hypothetical protein